MPPPTTSVRFPTFPEKWSERDALLGQSGGGYVQFFVSQILRICQTDSVP